MKPLGLSSAILLAAALAAGGCEFQRKSTAPSPTATVSLEPTDVIPSLLGTWRTTSTAPAATTGITSCTNFAWTVATQTATDIAGTFTAVCLGSANITGQGQAHIDGSTVAITINGNGTMPGLTSCPFSVTGNGTISGDQIVVPYSGSTCLGPLSGTKTISRGYIQGAPSAPTLHAPANGATLSTRRPTLTVLNMQPQAPNDVMQYVFEIGTDANVSNPFVTATVAGGSSTTSYTVLSDLSYGTRYYWHAKTIDAGRPSSFSGAWSFTTPVAETPPPPPPPGPSNELDMRVATILNSPLDMGNWSVSTKITALDLRSTGVHVEFSKRDGAGRWPDVYPSGWDEPLQYTLGMCLNISARWYCSAPIQFWYGLDQSGGPPSQYAQNWFYDPSRWSPMTGHQPAQGETVGFFVCEGNCRNNTTGSESPLRERSNVVLVPFPGSGGGGFVF